MTQYEIECALEDLGPWGNESEIRRLSELLEDDYRRGYCAGMLDMRKAYFDDYDEACSDLPKQADNVVYLLPAIEELTDE